MTRLITRRGTVAGLTIGAGGLLSGCDAIGNNKLFREALIFRGSDWNETLQRALMKRGALAPEYRPDQRSPIFRTNGTTNPGTSAYAAHAANHFADWKLTVDGMVKHPLSLTMAQLRSMPTRTQITRHDCVEGWSAIGQWTGPHLSMLLDLAGLRDGARYIVLHCADRLYGRNYYESIDLLAAYHPQTILAWRMNGAPLQIGHGAPVRLRVERQLGYKQAKYINHIEAVSSLASVGQGKGGLWEDVANYDWYAGI